MTQMRFIQMLKLRARSLFQRGAVERELARELQAHLDEQIEEYIARGMTPEHAKQTALREFGGLARFQEEVRDTWRVSLLGDLRRDLRYSWRGLLRSPVLLIVSVLSIGLGVAVNTTIFALANTLFLQPPTARNASQLVHIRVRGRSHVSYNQWRGLERASG